jgi:hypothetical protein
VAVLHTGSFHSAVVFTEDEKTVGLLQRLALAAEKHGVRLSIDRPAYPGLEEFVEDMEAGAKEIEDDLRNR